MTEFSFEKLLAYLAEELTAKERKMLEEHIVQRPILIEIVEGLKKLEAELPEGITTEQYLALRKDFLRKKVFDRIK